MEARRMQTHLLERCIAVPRPLDEVFGYFADARNLQELTPRFLDFHILTPMPIALRVGTLIDYKLRLHGVPIRWRTRIDACDPPHSFVDIQLRGPYALWRHTHRFHAIEGGTLIVDSVRYAMWAPLIEPLVHGLFVLPSLERIFAYRRRVMAERFGELIPGGEPA